MEQQNLHNQFDQVFAGHSSAQMLSVVQGASARTQGIKFSQETAPTSQNLQDATIAKMGLEAMVAAGNKRGLDSTPASASAGPGRYTGHGILGFGIAQIRDVALTGAAAAVNPALGVVVGSALMGRQAAHAAGLGIHAPAPMAHQRSPHTNASIGYMASSLDASSGKGSDVISPSQSRPTDRAMSFAAESDQVRQGPTSGARAFGRATAPQPQNVFERMATATPITAQQHEQNKANLARIEQQIFNIGEVAAHGVVARPENITDPARAALLQNSHERDGIIRSGRLTLEQTGYVGAQEARNFGNFAIKPPQISAPMPAPSFA